jgi:hypothetical protein
VTIFRTFTFHRQLIFCCVRVVTKSAYLFHVHIDIWDKVLTYFMYVEMYFMYRVIRNDCRGFNNLSYTIH